MRQTNLGGDWRAYEHARYLFFGDFHGDGAKEMVANIPLNGSLTAFKLGSIGYSQEMIEDSLTLSSLLITAGDIDNDGKSEIITSTLTNDALLLYQWEEGEWKRKVLARDLIDIDNGERRIIAVAPLNSSEGGYKKILYATLYTSYAGAERIQTTSFYVLEYEPLKDVWEKKHIEDLEFDIASWGIFPAFP